MDFFDIRAGAAKKGARPVVRTNDKSVTISIPRDIADKCGLAGAKTVKVQFGQDGDKAALRISADPTGRWNVRQSTRLLTLYVPEIMPTEPVAETESDYEPETAALTIALPSPWRLAHAAVLLKGAPYKRAGR